MRMNRYTIVVSLAVMLMPGAAIGQGDDRSGIAGREIGLRIFETMVSDNREAIHMGDLERFRASVFSGMDYDDDGNVTYDEFASWDPGFVAVAEELGRSDAYTTASKIVFAFWDRNGDGSLTERELRAAMSADFRRADFDGDALLTKNEFIGGFPIMVAMRAAIRPDL